MPKPLMTLASRVSVCCLSLGVSGLTLSRPLAAQSGSGGSPASAVGTAASTSASASAPTASAPAGSGTAAPAPAAAPDPHSLPIPLAAGGGNSPLLLMSGDPLASPAHIRQASLARENQVFQPQDLSRPEAGMKSGSVGVLLRSPSGAPIADRKVTLKRLHESIQDGNTNDERSSTTNAQGHAGFVDQSTESSYLYEVITHEGEALYSSGQFRLDRDHGQLVVLNVFPTTPDINQTFIASRALNVVEPRDDVFQIQTLFRFHNTNGVTWVPQDLRIALPAGWMAFRPGNPTGDITLLEEDGKVRVKGTFSPGDHEISFSYQLPNPGESAARLAFPVPPHLMDAKVFLESSSKMGLSSPHLDPAQETRGKNGQRALMAVRDFLSASTPRPNELVATVTGLPTTGWGAPLAALIAALTAAAGVYLGFGHGRRQRSAIAESDRLQARELLLKELLLLEQAFKTEQIGPKTYEQTKRTLIDSLARVDARQSA